MDSKKSNKISDIVRLQQILKKWKKLANAPKKTTTTTTTTVSGGGKSTIKFFKRTLSFNDVVSSATTSGGGDQVVPKGYVAVCVGEELKRYVIPMEYLGHEAFGILLRKAEEEFGFQQEGALKIPCEVDVFDNILNMVRNRNKKSDQNALLFLNDFGFDLDDKDRTLANCCSPDRELTPSRPPQVCR